MCADLLCACPVCLIICFENSDLITSPVLLLLIIDRIRGDGFEALVPLGCGKARAGLCYVRTPSIQRVVAGERQGIIQA